VLREFKAFVTRRSLVDLAVGLVIALAAFALIKSLITNIVLPIIAVPGSVEFSSLSFTVNGSTIAYGSFLQDLVTFLSTAAGVFFGVVRPLARLNKTDPVPTADCPRCLSTVPAAASRCPFCTSDLVPS
jgi:large conductance mechanosensitive channel